jgi:hypothetical protein
MESILNSLLFPFHTPLEAILICVYIAILLCCHLSVLSLTSPLSLLSFFSTNQKIYLIMIILFNYSQKFSIDILFQKKLYFN